MSVKEEDDYDIVISAEFSEENHQPTIIPEKVKLLAMELAQSIMANQSIKKGLLLAYISMNPGSALRTGFQTILFDSLIKN